MNWIGALRPGPWSPMICKVEASSPSWDWLVERIAVVEHLGGERSVGIATEEDSLDAVLLTHNVATRWIEGRRADGGKVNAPYRHPRCSQILAVETPSENCSVRQKGIRGNECGGEKGSETVADMDDFVWLYQCVEYCIDRLCFSCETVQGAIAR